MVRGALLLGAVLLASGGSARAADDEPAIPGSDSRAAFLRAAHSRVHATWGSFLRNSRDRLPATDPVNRGDRSVTVAVTLIPDGTVMQAIVEKSSGSQQFDAAALDLFQDTILPQPSEEAFSDDGRAHLRWVFARDTRQCSGVTVVTRESPLDEALPRLLEYGKDREALRRVRLAAVTAQDTALGMLARAWLGRALELTVQSLPAAIGLASVDDTRGVGILREALARGERVPEVTAALVRLKMIPQPAQPPAAPERPAERMATEVLVRQLRAAELTARVEAAAALSGRSDGAARQAVAALVRSPDPELRLFGAGTLDRRARATLFADVGPAGRTAYRTLVRGPGRTLAGEWLVSQFDTLTPSAQVAALSDWLWNSREASPITLSVR